MDESFHTYDMPGSDYYVMTNAIAKEGYLNESCHTYESDTSHVCISQVTYMDESCHTCDMPESDDYVMTNALAKKRYVNESYHTHL